MTPSNHFAFVLTFNAIRLVILHALSMKQEEPELEMLKSKEIFQVKQLVLYHEWHYLYFFSAGISSHYFPCSLLLLTLPM